MNESSISRSNDTHSTSEEISASISFEINIQKKAPTKKQIINAISLNLEEIIKENDEYKEHVEIDKFYISNIPNISLYEYIKRIVKHTDMNISTLIDAVIYIDKYCERQKYVLSYHNIYLIVLSSCLLSYKFNEDLPINNKYYAKIGGITVAQLNELEFIFYLNSHFSLLVDEHLYNSYYDFLSNYPISN